VEVRGGARWRRREAFDVLQVGRHDIPSFPLTRRRSILEDAIADLGDGAAHQTPRFRRIAGVADSAAPGLERLVAKDPESAANESSRSVGFRTWTPSTAFSLGNGSEVRGIVEWGFYSADVLGLLREAKHSRQRTSATRRWGDESSVVAGAHSFRDRTTVLAIDIEMTLCVRAIASRASPMDFRERRRRHAVSAFSSRVSSIAR